MDKSREDKNRNNINDNDNHVMVLSLLNNNSNDNHVMILPSLNNTSNDNTRQFLKRKRTKRQRSLATTTMQPLAALGLMGSTVTGGGDDDDDDNTNLTGYVNLCTDIEVYKGANNNNGDEEEEEEDEEEQDLANCLILLAQGKSRHEDQAMVVNHEVTRNYIYQCKTCDRCFTSFQALGGHRASHKKLKSNGSFDQVVEVKKKPISQQQPLKDHDCLTTLSLQVSSTRNNTTAYKSSKVHECSICGAGFSSGQALGGHMRRHRALLASAAPIRAAALVTSNHDHQRVIMCPKVDEKKLPAANVFSLDLNLPATAEDQDQNIIQRESKFAFDSTEVIALC